MTDSTPSSSRPRILSGMRPTGKLHLGNYMGALHNWVKLQHEYECYFFIADYHALTTDYADPSLLKQNIFEVALDFLSAGLDPKLCTIFVQSHVPQHAELHLLLSMITPVSWLERVPTYKDQQEQLREKDLATYGFLGYPLLQSADILLYQPKFVPVGQDQVSHIELTREVARRFNLFYGSKPADVERRLIAADSDKDKIVALEGVPRTFAAILPEPQVLLTPSPKLPGIDGRKMSKSYGNTILLSDHPAVVLQKMAGMSNGGQRPTQHDPGDPEICPVGDMHRNFSSERVLAHISNGCRTATIRCDECKTLAASGINLHLHPIRERREELLKAPEKIWDILDDGAIRAASRSEETMQAVRAVTGLSRDRSGIRVEKPMFAAQDAQQVRDLSSLKDWWNLATPLLVRNLRDIWKKDLTPSGTPLRADAEGVWITQNNRRVFVTAATQTAGKDSWTFSIKPKSYEFLVLLCWWQDFSLHDFVVPQKRYLESWTKTKKAAGKTNIEVRVERRDGKYVLQLPNAAPIEITDTEANYNDIAQ